MYSKLIISGALVVALGACAARGPTKEQVDIDYSLKAQNSISVLIADFRTKHPADCSDEDMIYASQGAENIRAKSAFYHSGIDPTRHDISTVQQISDLQVLQTLDPLAIQATFRVADAYLAAECLDQADAGYREILNTYIGGSFAAARQRAQVGIEDVRALRLK